ncbi:host attachment protein [Halomonas denitrificans]|nr:host attachment protein [Halomonas denitrificans]
MSKQWILVAESARARLFVRAAPRGALREIEDFDHPDSRKKGHELETDRSGAVDQSHGHALSDSREKGAAQRIEAETFARQLADHLRTARGRNEFEQLVLIADPRFLGMLRDHLDDATRDCVVASIDKNLVGESVERIKDEIDDI